MQSIRLNRPAAGFVGCILFVLLCLVIYFPDSTDSEALIRAGRHGLTKEGKIPGLKVGEHRKSDSPKDSTLVKNVDNVHIGYHDEVNEKRRQKVVEMMQHAWNGYKNYSWGHNEVRPVSKSPNTQAIFGGGQMPATIIDAADTLWIMGLWREYSEARDYIRDNFDISNATGTMSVFEVTIRFLGGLLSLYALTGEIFYMNKAQSIAEALLPAFNTPTGIPKAAVNMKTKYTSNYGWANGASLLAEVGSLHLEFTYLSKIAKAPIFAKKVKKIRDALYRVEKIDGLYSNYIDPNTGTFTSSHHISVGALGDSFYEYLLKSWLQSGKTDEQARIMYWNASKAIRSKMVFKSKSGLTYVAEIRNRMVEHKMGHLACFSAGMFALQAVNEKDLEAKESTMAFAEELGRTCHESYVRTPTRIGPEMFYFSGDDEATSKHGENNYLLRPEVIESFFYLWRLTGKTRYRNWVWDAITAIDKHCRVEGGFSGLVNVYDPKTRHDDVQQSFFLAETLKYAYLTFADEWLIPLDHWVFNTEAHPLPVLNS